MIPWSAYTSLGAGWHLLVVTAVLFAVGALVNRFAPHRRPSLRRAVTLFSLYALATILHALPAMGAAERWTGIAHELLESFTLVHLGAIVVFDLVLETLRIELAAITVDLVMGAAYALTGFVVLTAAGVEITSVFAASTVIAAILTISLQSTLGNVIGGIAVQIDGSVHQGEWVRLDSGKEGRVTSVGWRHTLIETRDGDSMVVPNSTLLASAFTILGKRDGLPHPHRMWVHFHVDFRHPPAEVCRAVLAAIQATPIPNVAEHPAPDALCLDLGREGRDSMGLYAVRYWLIDLAKDEPTSSLVRARVHAGLRRAGIPLARPSVTQFVVPADEETDAARSARRHRRAASTLRELSLFAALTDEEIEQLAAKVQFTPFAAGETITRQGAVAHFLYILHHGTVEIRVRVEDEEKFVSTVEAPGFFGEMGLMTGEPRQASVVATTDTICYRLGKSALDAIIQNRPEIAAGMSAVLAERRVQLSMVRDDLDGAARKEREASEREDILNSIRGFFGLGA